MTARKTFIYRLSTKISILTLFLLIIAGLTLIVSFITHAFLMSLPATLGIYFVLVSFSYLFTTNNPMTIILNFYCSKVSSCCYKIPGSFVFIVISEEQVPLRAVLIDFLYQ